MKLIFSFILAVLIFYYSFNYFFSSSKIDYENIADNVTEETANKLKKEQGLCLVGTGGQMMNDIQMMMMGFNFYEIVDIETARQLLVDSVEEYLLNINSSEEIKPYLHDHPFTYKNIEIVIYFYNSSKSDVPCDEISIASANQGRVKYYIDYPEKHTIKSVYEETYEEAFRAVYPEKRESEALSS